MHKLILLGLMALGIAACAAATDVGEQTLVGEIHIKGSDLFPTITLETTTHDSWELVGMPLDEARPLAGREVKVRGAVISNPGAGAWLPSMRVNGKAEPVQK